MKLIDILNKIANGELEEGTEMLLHTGLIKGENHSTIKIKRTRNNLITEDGESIFVIMNLNILEDEVELIEPEHIRENTKMIEDTQIPELDISELEIEGIDDLAFAFENMCDQLNKAIRKANEQTKVILALDKEIKEIKEQLDY